MRKNVFGRQFKRDINERKALFKGLMTELVMHERIETTEEKAKAIRASVEKLVTKARTQGAAAERILLPYLHADAVKKMIEVIGPRFAQRPGGYTRIMRIGTRFNDNATVVMMEWVERSVAVAPKTGKGKKVEKSTEQVEATADVKKPEKKAVNKKIVKDDKKPVKVKNVKPVQSRQKKGDSK